MQVNGKKLNMPAGISVKLLLEKLNLGDKRVVVAVNWDVIPADNYSLTLLGPDDRVEIVNFVGGG